MVGMASSETCSNDECDSVLVWDDDEDFVSDAYAEVDIGPDNACVTVTAISGGDPGEAEMASEDCEREGLLALCERPCES